MRHKTLLPALVFVSISCAPGAAASLGPAAAPAIEASGLTTPHAFADVASDLTAAIVPATPDSSLPEACSPNHAPGAGQNWRSPLSPAPVYSPPEQRRVGLQAGHWLNEERPA